MKLTQKSEMAAERTTELITESTVCLLICCAAIHSHTLHTGTDEIIILFSRWMRKRSLNPKITTATKNKMHPCARRMSLQQLQAPTFNEMLCGSWNNMINFAWFSPSLIRLQWMLVPPPRCHRRRMANSVTWTQCVSGVRNILHIAIALHWNGSRFFFMNMHSHLQIDPAT